ncbi:ubiquitin-conjugating enzyme E2 S [Quaeritorhiza haematococci]|nr:ubiquitin-conjugating enzyme E2 S [Quaeritorhiza haematococci]
MFIGTPFEKGAFRIKLVFGENFPNTPPKGYFLTKIFHPNVSKSGEICVNTLKRDWKKELGIGHILLTVKCLLIVPNAESALNEEAGRLLLEDYESFASHARTMTSIHALNSRVEFSSSSSSASSTDNTNTTTTSATAKSSTDPKSTTNKATDAATATHPASTNEVLAVNNGQLVNANAGGSGTGVGTGGVVTKKRGPEKKLEKAKVDKKRSLRRL